MTKQICTSGIIILIFISNVLGARFIFPDDPLYSKLIKNDRFLKRDIIPPQLPLNSTSIEIEKRNFENTTAQENKLSVSSIKVSAANISTSTLQNISTLSNLIANNINNFGLQINNVTDSFKDTKIFSPLNIAEALMLLWLGSNGNTFDEIAKVMNFQNNSFDIYNHSQTIHEQIGLMLQSLKSKTDEQPRLTTASALFIQNGYSIGQKYREIAMTSYQSNVTYLNFAQKNVEAQKYINTWISNNTNGLIKEILTTPPPPTTKVLLTTALYFKGMWEYPFSSELTHRAVFYPNGNGNNSNTVEVDMMANFEVFNYTYDKNLNSEVLCLPYKGGTASMYIIAPKKSSKQKITEITQQLNSSVIDNLIKNLKPMQLGLLMPKMKFESTIHLSSTLQQLGVKSLFNSNTAGLKVLSPGFTYPNNTKQSIDEIRNQINGNSDLYVEEIVHKVYININELGTEATAITDLLISRGGMKKVNINQPFIFFIRHHKTNLDLFLSTVHVPVPNYT